MRTPGKRVKRIRSIQTAKLIVAVDTEMVIPPSDPSEPDNASHKLDLTCVVLSKLPGVVETHSS